MSVIKCLKTIPIFIVFANSHAVASGNNIDCNKSKPFSILDTLKADVTVTQNLGNNDVEICRTTKPLEIPVLDIQGREAEWFYCYKRDPKIDLTCKGTYQGKDAQLLVRPAIVTRSWRPSAALDVHMHVLLIQSRNPQYFKDTFTRTLNFDLKQREFTIEGRSGDWTSETDVQDAYEVRTRFYK